MVDGRRQILEKLHLYKPTPEEEANRQKMIEFIERHPDCFERTLEIGHVTSSAWLLSQDGLSVLLTHHARLNRWMQLGGHCDGDSDVLRSALREAKEESGIQGIVALSDQIFDIDIHPIPARGIEKAHEHYDIRFLFQVLTNEPYIVSSESKDLRWFSQKKTWVFQERSLLRMKEKWSF